MARIVVIGGSGFLGAHLCDAFVARGDVVVAVDNLTTGRLENLARLDGHPRFTFLRADVSHDLPQTEAYNGNVDPNGPRAVYDQAKRFAETLTSTYRRMYGLRTAIARIFNTYGPRLRPADGRVVSNFLVQAIDGKPLTLYGSGTHTRSFCYVTDQVRGILALYDSDMSDPVNIGNPSELTRELLDWEPRVPLREGLSLMHAWYLEERRHGRS